MYILASQLPCRLCYCCFCCRHLPTTKGVCCRGPQGRGGASTACLPALNYKHPASVPEPYFVSILPRIATSFAFPESPAREASFHDTTAIKQPKHRSIIHLAKALTPQHRQTYRRERPLPASSSIYPSQYPAYRRNDGVLLLLARLSPRPRVQPPLPKHLGPG